MYADICKLKNIETVVHSSTCGLLPYRYCGIRLHTIDMTAKGWSLNSM